MKKSITLAQVTAIAAGVAATGTSLVMNLEAVSMQAGASNGEYAGVIAANITAATGLAFAACARRSRHSTIAASIVLAWCLGFALDGYTTFERKQFTAQERLKTVADHNAPIIRAQAAGWCHHHARRTQIHDHPC